MSTEAMEMAESQAPTPVDAPDKVSRAFLANPLELPEQDYKKGKPDLYSARDIPDLLRKTKARIESEDSEPPSEEVVEKVDGETEPQADAEVSEVEGEQDVEDSPTFKDAFIDEDLNTPLYEAEVKAAEPKPLFEEDEKKFVERQSYEDQEVLEILRWAEAKGEESGKSKEYIEFLQKHEQFVTREGESFDAEGYEYQDWLKENRPNIDRSNFKKLQREYIVDEATARAKAEMREEQSKLKRKVEEFEKKPQLEAQITKFSETLFTHLPKEVQDTLSKFGAEEGPKKLMQSYPIQTEVTGREVAAVEQQGRALIELSRGALSYDSSNPVHEQLGNKIINYGKQMLSHPKGDQVLIRDGKKFVPREQFGQLTAEQQDQSWTFSPNEILSLLGEEMKVNIDAGIQKGLSQQEQLESRILAKHGYAKKSATDVPVSSPQEVVSENASVKSRPASTPPLRRSSPKPSGGLKDFMTNPLEL
tara:strand:+ start:3206 stop:4633 length:1428 start_codon:yes stop_codon:yes gene_type:complete